MVEVLRRELRLRGRGDAKEHRVVRRDRAHVFLDAVEHAFFLVVDAREKAGLAVVRFDPARRALAEVAGHGDQIFQHRHIEAAARRHARDDAHAAHRDVRVLVRDQDGRADALVAAARGVGAVDAGEDRYPGLLELGVAEEAGARAAAVGVELFLIGKLHAAAIHQPHERQVEPLGEVCHPQHVLGLTGYPGACEHFVVEADDHRPAAADPAQAVDDVGGAFLVIHRVVEAVQGHPGARVDEVFQPLPHRERATLVDLRGRQADLAASVARGCDRGLDLLQLGAAFLRAGDAVFLQRLAEAGHFFEIRSHCSTPGWAWRRSPCPR